MHDDLILETVGIGKLRHDGGVFPRHDRRGLEDKATGRAGGDEAGLGASGAAITRPAAMFKSSRFTMVLDAFSITSATSGLSLLPPYIVVVPEAAMAGVTPRLR